MKICGISVYFIYDKFVMYPVILVMSADVHCALFQYSICTVSSALCASSTVLRHCFADIYLT